MSVLPEPTTRILIDNPNAFGGISPAFDVVAFEADIVISVVPDNILILPVHKIPRILVSDPEILATIFCPVPRKL